MQRHRPQTPMPPTAGGFAPRPPSSGGWGASSPDPRNSPPMRISGYAPALSSSVLCANPTHKYPNCLFKYYLHLQQHTSARAAFQLLYISKTKARNQSEVKDDRRLALSSTKPRITKLACGCTVYRRSNRCKIDQLFETKYL